MFRTLKKLTLTPATVKYPVAATKIASLIVSAHGLLRSPTVETSSAPHHYKA
jgi:hypothetical protein